jgi:hypothetical protein
MKGSDKSSVQEEIYNLDSSLKATGWTVGGLKSREGKIFPACSDLPRGLPTLL